MAVDLSNRTIGENAEQEYRFRCLELAINTPDRQGTDIDPFRLARKYYAFTKEKDGDNVIEAALDFKRLV